MKRFLQNKESEAVFRRVSLFMLTVLAFAAVFFLPPISQRAAWAADESTIELLTVS